MQFERTWHAVLGELEIQVSAAIYNTWFKTSRLLAVEGDCATIGVSNSFGISTLQGRYDGLIREKLVKNNLPITTVKYKLNPVTIKQESADELLKPQNVPSRQGMSAPSSPQAITPRQTDNYNNGFKPANTPARPQLNDKYVFDSFVVGAGNELAFAACQSIALQPGTRYNPLYLYGGVGIGKTHLMQAAGNAIKANNPDARIIYINTENFVKEFVNALRTRTTSEFTNYYRSADVLIVDDIQFIAGKEKVQEEFFHTFNTLHMANKQIIMSSDKPPKEIPSLEDRLSSRFAWGMSLDMQIPDFETRCAIIQTKALGHGVELDIDVVEYMANKFKDNIRELEGSLNQLLASCELRKVEPTLSVAVAELGNIRQARPKHLSAKQVIERTARHFQITTEEILGPKRDKDIVVPRQIAMYLMREELKLSLPKIAKELGRKDHTTAMHSIDKIMKALNDDEDIREAVTTIKEHLYA